MPNSDKQDKPRKKSKTNTSNNTKHPPNIQHRSNTTSAQLREPKNSTDESLQHSSSSPLSSDAEYIPEKQNALKDPRYRHSSTRIPAASTKTNKRQFSCISRATSQKIPAIPHRNSPAASKISPDIHQSNDKTIGNDVVTQHTMTKLISP
jgi:hypothetical protein